jgi:serine/threonine-protein kinase
VRAELGRGATCVVYRSWDPQLRREVALKVLRNESPVVQHQQATLAARLEREAQTLARLRHDHIVPIFEPGLAEGRPYFVLEYVRGGSLRDRLAELSAAGPHAFVPLLGQVARAVQYAHEHGILHRDLKPANVLLAEGGRALVSDFGLAKLLSGVSSPECDPTADTVTYQAPEAPDASTRLTATGFQPGTPAYMAPEQYEPSFGDVSPATDVWALGVILYELLTGEKPFRGRTRAEVQAQVCAGKLVRPRQRRRGVDRRLEAIVLRCLQTDPRRRYPTARDFANALAAWQARWLRRLAVAALLAGLAFVAAALWGHETSPERRYQRATAAHAAALRRGGSVNLVPAGVARPPLHRVRAGEQSTTVSQSERGLAIECQTRCGLVELCPAVPLEHYRVRARVRAIKLPSPDATWGVYVNHTLVNTDPGPQHYFEAAYFQDDAGLLPLRPGPPAVEAALLPRWFSYHHPTSIPGSAEHFPYRNARGTLDPGWTSVEGQLPAGAQKTPWRTIQIDVHATEVSARCGGGGLAQELDLGTIRPKNRTDFVRGLGFRFPDLRGINVPINGSAAGVYVDSAVVDVGEFVIEPLPEP